MPGGYARPPIDASIGLILPLRMEQHCKNGLEIARFLESHSAISRVIYPRLESHPHHELAKRQMIGGFGGIVSFQLKGGIGAAVSFAEKFACLFTPPHWDICAA